MIKYNERIEQQEAEELKKMASILSKHNRFARETALKERLAHSLKLYLAVLNVVRAKEISVADFTWGKCITHTPIPGEGPVVIWD